MAYWRGKLLLYLLGLPTDTKVLWLGERKGFWKDQFDPSQLSFRLNVSDELKSYGLVFLTIDKYLGNRNLKQFVDFATSVRKDNSKIITFASNSFSFQNLKSLVTQPSYDKFRKLLPFSSKSFPSKKLGGFNKASFLALPDPERATEFLCPKIERIDIPCYSSILVKALHKFGFYRFSHPGYWHISSQTTIEDGPLFHKIKNTLGIALGTEHLALRLDKFEIRDRGSLVVFLSEMNSAAKIVAKVVFKKADIKRAKRNFEFITWLHSNFRVPEFVKNRTPSPLGEFTHEDLQVFIETRLPGILAWKLGPKSRYGHVWMEAVKFINTLFYSCAVETELDERTLSELFFRDMKIIVSSNFADPETIDLLVRAIIIAKNQLLGLSMPMGPTHGDYGGGNITACPKTSKVYGVFDWDTGRYRDLPGIDLINMEIQRRRSNAKESLSRSVAAIASLVASSEKFCNEDILMVGKDEEKRRYVWKSLFLVTIIRYVTRALQYPTLFNRDEKDYIDTLRWALQNLRNN